MSADEQIAREAVAEANAWRTRAEQAEALVGRLMAAFADIPSIHFDGRTTECRMCERAWVGADHEQHADWCPRPRIVALLADPLGTRLVEEQRALREHYEAALAYVTSGGMTTANLYRLHQATADVERARKGETS